MECKQAATGYNFKKLYVATKNTGKHDFTKQWSNVDTFVI